MYTFIKLYRPYAAYPEKGEETGWYLLYQRLSFDDEVLLHQNRIKAVRRSDDMPDELKTENIRMAIRAPFLKLYEEISEKYPDRQIIINPAGGYCFINEGDKIIAQVEKETIAWPTDSADVIICENDPFPESWWMDLLGEQYTGKSISTLTNFYKRSVEEIIGFVENCEVVTFTTTFSNVDWFHNLMSAMSKYPDKKMFIHTHDTRTWENLTKQYPQLKSNPNITIYDKHY